MRAAVLHDFHQPLVIEDVTALAPGPGEVQVRMAASGVCRSDLHVMEGLSPVARLPMVLGHEGAGVIEAVGEGVEDLRPGTRVVIAQYPPCGSCSWCRRGDPVHCDGPSRLAAIFGEAVDGSTRLRLGDRPLRPMIGAGSLAEVAVVSARQVVPVPDDVPLDALCLAGCGVTTGVGAALNTAKVEPGSSVAVVGCGGVGLNVVQGARIAGATTIIAVDRQPAKLTLATELGATDTVLVEDGDPVAQVRALVPGGVDYAFEVIGSPTVLRQVFAMSREGGTTVMVGVPPLGSEITVDARTLFLDRRLIGCMGGSNIPTRDIPRIVALYRQGRLKLDELISQRLTLDRVNEAFDALHAGELARSVVILDESLVGR